MINSKDLLLHTKDLNILFAEDHNELREGLSEILNSFFKNVTTVKDGQEALDLYVNNFIDNKSAYDIVLSDIQMPQMNGVELTKEIYNLNPSQIVIIISAHDESKYLLPLINLGIEYFITKPIDYEEFMNVLQNSAQKFSNLSSIETIDNKTQIKLSDDTVFDKHNSALLKNGQNVYLTKYEILFLQLLTKQMGKIFPNEEIVEFFSLVDESIDAQNIRKLVSKLRKKLPANSLESIYAVGYKMLEYIE